MNKPLENDFCSCCPDEYKIKHEGIINASSLSRRDARSLVFHLLYAMDVFDYDISLNAIAANFDRGFGFVITTEDDIFKEAESIIEQRAALDEEIRPLLDNWKFERLGVCTRLIMRLALWELKNTEIDTTIVINEAIELAKCFAETDAFKFVNGILDEWVKQNKPQAENQSIAPQN